MTTEHDNQSENTGKKNSRHLLSQSCVTYDFNKQKQRNRSITLINGNAYRMISTVCVKRYLRERTVTERPRCAHEMHCQVAPAIGYSYSSCQRRRLIAEFADANKQHQFR